MKLCLILLLIALTSASSAFRVKRQINNNNVARGSGTNINNNNVGGGFGGGGFGGGIGGLGFGGFNPLLLGLLGKREANETVAPIAREFNETSMSIKREGNETTTPIKRQINNNNVPGGAGATNINNNNVGGGFGGGGFGGLGFGGLGINPLLFLGKRYAQAPQQQQQQFVPQGDTTNINNNNVQSGFNGLNGLNFPFIDPLTLLFFGKREADMSETPRAIQIVS